MRDFETLYRTNPKHEKDPKYSKLHFAAKINYSIKGGQLISEGANVNAKDIHFQNLVFIF